MSAYDNLKCVSIGTEKKMGFERDEFIERTEKQKMWLYTGGAFDYIKEITFLDGQTVELKAGKILIGKSKGENGYEIVYYCNEYLRTHNVEPHYYKCSLSLGASAL